MKRTTGLKPATFGRMALGGSSGLSRRLRRRTVVCSLLVSAFMTVGASTPAALAVPPNDDFADAAALPVGTEIEGTMKGATRQRGEPRHGGTPAEHSVWYRFRAEHRVTIALDTCESKVNTVIAVYRGRSLRSLRAVDFNNNNMGCRTRFRASRVAFTARRGRSYSIAVVGFRAKRDFRLKVTALAAPRYDDFVDALPLRLGSTIVATTRDATRELGEPGYSWIGARTVWFRLRVSVASDVALDACNTRYPALAVYTGARLTRLSKTTDFPGCVLRLVAQPGVTYRVQAEDGGRGGKFRLTARRAKPPPNDDFAAATPIELGTSINGTTRDASREPGEPIRTFTPLSVWFRLTLGATTTVEGLSPCELGQNLLVGVYSGDQLDQLALAFTHEAGEDCVKPRELGPGVYSIQVEAQVYEQDFVLSPRVVTPPP